MRDADQKAMWVGLTTRKTVVEQMNDEIAPIVQDDLIPIFHAVRSMVGEAEKIGLSREELTHYKRVMMRFEGQLNASKEEDRTIHINGYDLYWMRKACNFWLPVLRKFDSKNPDLKALEEATKRLNAIKDEALEHQVEDGHTRQS